MCKAKIRIYLNLLIKKYFLTTLFLLLWSPHVNTLPVKDIYAKRVIVLLRWCVVTVRDYYTITLFAASSITIRWGLIEYKKIYLSINNLSTSYITLLKEVYRVEARNFCSSINAYTVLLVTSHHQLRFRKVTTI